MPSYLVHFNRLHDKRGRFTYGDGDGDGRRDDRKIGEGDRSYDTPNSGRRNYEGGGGGRIGGGRTSSGKQSKSEVTKNQQYRKPEYNGNTRGGRSKGMQLPDTALDNILSNKQTFKTEVGNVNSLGSNHSGRRISSDVSSKISSFGPVTPKIPGLGDGSGGSKGNWSGNLSGSGKGSNQQSGKSINFVGYPRTEGSNITVVGSSKGAGVSLSSEQIEDYRVAGENWVVDTIDKITDPEWWKEKEKKARVQLGIYTKADKTPPKKQEKKKTR